MFSLERQKALFSNLNARAEKHGDDTVPAADLAIVFDTSNDLLSEFHPSLKSSLYRKPEASDDQGELLKDEPGYMPKLRFSEMSGFKWETQLVGATVTVHHGPSGKSDIVLGDCTVDSFKFQPKDGGTVNVAFRVQCKPDEKQVGKLFTMIQDDIEISIDPPKADQEAL